MKKLTTKEIKEFAECLFFTEAEAKEVTDLFYKIKSERPDNWRVGKALDTVDEYIDEWEDHWHREESWQEYYDYEKEQYMYCYADTDEEAEAIFKDLETFKKEVSASLYFNGSSYELSNGVIVIVC